MKSSHVILLVCLTTLPVVDSARGDSVTRIDLENGLTVLLRPVAKAENVALMTLYSIGNDHDPDGKSGLAHLIEHLYVCCGAGDTPPRTVQQFMQAYPAGWNAYTGDDFTLYATVAPRGHLDAELEDAAARMTRLRVTAEEIEREKARLVAEVTNMFAGNPDLAAFNLGRHQVRPGRKRSRRGGVPEQVRTITAKDVVNRLQGIYKPRNAILVVAGGFEAATTQTRMEKLFKDIRPGVKVPAVNDLAPPNSVKPVTFEIK